MSAILGPVLLLALSIIAFRLIIGADHGEAVAGRIGGVVLLALFLPLALGGIESLVADVAGPAVPDGLGRWLLLGVAGVGGLVVVGTGLLRFLEHRRLMGSGHGKHTSMKKRVHHDE